MGFGKLKAEVHTYTYRETLHVKLSTDFIKKLLKVT